MLLVWLALNVDQGGLWLDGQKQRFGHRGHVQLRIKVRKRMAIGVDDKVVLDGRHVCDKVVGRVDGVLRHEVVGGVDGVLRLETVVTELTDVSWQGRSEVCRERRLLGNLESEMGYEVKTMSHLYLVHMWWEVMFVGGRNTVTQLKFSREKLCSIYDPLRGKE